MNIEALQMAQSGLASYLRENILIASTADYRKALLTHRLMTDLIERDGGSPSDQAYALRRMDEIAQGNGIE